MRTCLIIVVVVSALWGASVGVNRICVVDPAEFWGLLEMHPALHRVRGDMTADGKITRHEMAVLREYLESHDHETECEPSLARDLQARP